MRSYRYLLLLFALVMFLPSAHADENRFWEMGHGFFCPYLSHAINDYGEMDLARWDWLVVEVNSAATVDLMNRLLEINPNLKFSVRIWPINGLGIPDENRGMASFLDYMLYPEKREEMDKRSREAIAALRENLSNWDSVITMHFLEEIPGAWGLGNIMRQPIEPGAEIPKVLEHHREAIEKVRGKPLAWDADMKWWMAETFLESMDMMHSLMKEASGGTPLIYWHHTNFATLDDVGDPLPADFDVAAWRGYPIYFHQIIKPGLCDGIMAYPNNAQIWENKYMRHIREHNWLFFSQLSHPSFMRLCSWEEAREMVHVEMPQNLGTFIYCEGSCAARGVWNDDRSMPDDPAWHQRRVSIPLHLRHLAKHFDVGFDVVNNYFNLNVVLDARLDDLTPGKVIHFVAIIQNPKDETFYNDPADAVAREVRVRLTLPEGVKADHTITAPPELALGDIPGGALRIADWWLTIENPEGLQRGEEIVVEATSSTSTPGRAATAVETSFPSLEPQNIARSNTSWLENGFRYGDLQPVIEIVGLTEPIKNPSITDGTNTLTYEGELWAGMRLIITPDRRARIYPANILAGAEEGLRDENDPSGYRAHTEGYLVHGRAVGSYLRPGADYRMTISGKATDEGNSLVVLRHVKPDREIWQPSVLANRFKEEWGEASAVFTVPDDVTGLERFYLYRMNSKGTVWYGPMSLVPAEIPDEGLDVSDRLTGRPLTITRGALTQMTYKDESPDSTSPKVRVRFYRTGDEPLTTMGPDQL